jgi:hypothetical protein
LHLAEFNLRIENNVGHAVQLRNPHRQLIAGREVEWCHDLRVAEDTTPLQYFEDQWNEFIARIGGEPERICSLADAVRTTSLVEECYHRRKRLEASWEKQMWEEYA